MNKLLVLVLMGIFLIGFTSAADWDNKLKYSDNDMKVDIENWFGIGGSHGSLELKSHKNINEVKEVGVGDQVVMWYDFNFNGKYSQGLGDVEFINMESGEYFDRDYSFVYWGDKFVDTYGYTKCKDKLSNGTKINCEYGITGKEKVSGWITYNSNDIPNGKLTIGLKVNVLPGETTDAIWTIAGKKISKHAAFTGVGEFGGNIEELEGVNNDYSVHLFAETNGIITQVRLGSGAANVGVTTVTIGQNGVDLASKASASYKYDTAPYVTFGLADYAGDIIQPNVAGGFFYINITKTSGTLEQGYKSGQTFDGSLFNYTSQSVPGRHASQPAVPVFTFNQTTIPPTVTLISPIDNYNSTSKEVIFNVSISDNDGIDNVTLYLDGDINETNSSEINDAYYTFTKNIQDGDHNWTIMAWNNVSLNTTATPRDFSVDSILPQITTEYPTGLTDYIIVGTNETLNVTFADTNLDSCWYDYNGTNVTIDGCQTGVKNSTLFLIESGNTNMTIYANDTFNNFNSTFISWSYKIIEDAISFESPVFEFESNTISVNITANSSLTSATLNWDSTDYSMTRTDLGSGLLNFETTFDIPPLSSGDNATFFFKYLYNGDFINSTDRNQTVNILLFDECNATLTERLVSFDMKSETNMTQTNFTLDGTFTFWVGDGTTFKNVSVDNSLALKNYNFCSNYDDNLTVSSIVNAQASGYKERTFFFNKLIYNNDTPTNHTLLLLNSSLGSSVIIQVTDSGLVPQEGLIANVYRYYPGSNEYIIVERARTDEFGQFVTRLIEPNTVKYQFEFLTEDNVLLKRTEDIAIACRNVICVIPFVIEDTTDDFARFDNVSDFDSTLSYSNITKIFTHTWNDNTGNTITSRLLVEKVAFNGTTIICNITSTSLASSLQCDVSSYGDGKFRAQSFRKISGESESRLALLNIEEGDPSTTFELEGVFWGFLLLFTLVAAGSFNPSVGIILYMVGFIGLGTLGVISMPIEVIVAQLVIGVLFIWGIRS